MIHNVWHNLSSSKAGFCWIRRGLTNICSLLVNPCWQILENSSRNFSEISVLRGMSWTDFWKITPSIFYEYPFSFCKISGNELDRFLENSSIFGFVFSEIGMCHAPEIFEYPFSNKCSILDAFSRNRPLSCPGDSPITVNSKKSGVNESFSKMPRAL